MCLTTVKFSLGESFVTNGSSSAKLLLALICLGIFILPVIANISIYLALIYLRAIKDKNKVGIDEIVIEDTSSEKVQTHSVPSLKDDPDKCHKNVEEAIQRSSTKVTLLNVDPTSCTSSMTFANKYCILNSDVEIGVQKNYVIHSQGEKVFLKNVNAINLIGPSHLIINLPISTELQPIKTITNIFKDQENTGHILDFEPLNTENLELTKIRKEKESAIRSIKTNLVLICILFVVFVLFLFPPKNWQFFLTALNESVQKSILPILTTTANFLPIQSIISQYIIYLKNLSFKCK